MPGLSVKKENLSPDLGELVRSTPAGELLVDSFEKVVGTPEEQGYGELVLYARSDSQVLLECYTDGGLDTERMTAYLVPIDAAKEALAAVVESEMDSWAGRDDTVGLCGMYYVCKFRNADGGYTRVSSEEMPPDGTAAFSAVRAALLRYARAEYLCPELSSSSKEEVL